VVPLEARELLSFGTGGVVTTAIRPNNDYASAVALYPPTAGAYAGDLVLAGRGSNLSPHGTNALIARYTPSGSLDTTFNGTGIVSTSLPSAASAVAAEPNGQVLVAGGSTLLRYNANGTLDKTFGSKGVVTVPFASAVAVEPNGQILVAGSAADPTTGTQDFALARYNSNGTVDTTFGSGGKEVVRLDGFADTLNALTLEADSSIVAVGTSATGTGNAWLIAHYNANGTLDTTFGPNQTGYVTPPLTSYTAAGYLITGGGALSVMIDPPTDPNGNAGKVVVGGSMSYTGGTWGLASAVVRLNANGTLDSTFGSGGVVTAGVDGASQNWVAVQSDGKVVAAGLMRGITGYGPGFSASRYNADGTLDTNYDASGPTPGTITV
jgi:uncharacterized delta-60 repeat protein